MGCKHNAKHDIKVNIIFLEDIGRYSAEVHIKCKDCGVPFSFLGLPKGLDLEGASTDVDGTELRVAIAPGIDPLLPPIKGVTGFSIKKKETIQ